MSVWPRPFCVGSYITKFGMHAQLDSESDMGWIPPNHTPLVCKAKKAKNCLLR